MRRALRYQTVELAQQQPPTRFMDVAWIPHSRDQNAVPRPRSAVRSPRSAGPGSRVTPRRGRRSAPRPEHPSCPATTGETVPKSGAALAASGDRIERTTATSRAETLGRGDLDQSGPPGSLSWQSRSQLEIRLPLGQAHPQPLHHRPRQAESRDIQIGRLRSYNLADTFPGASPRSPR